MSEYTLAKEFNTTAVFKVDADTPIQASQKFQETIDRISNEIFDKEYKVEGKCDFHGEEVIKVTEFLEYNINEENAMIYDDGFNIYDLSGIEIPRKTLDNEFVTPIDEENILEKTETDKVKFIWGLKAHDDLSGLSAGLFTLNDIDIVYDFEERQYCLGVEEIYDFSSKKGKVEYYKSLANAFKEYLLSLGFTEERLEQTNKCSIFETLIPTKIIEGLVPLKSRTLLDLYYKFILFIKVLDVIV